MSFKLKTVLSYVEYKIENIRPRDKNLMWFRRCVYVVLFIKLAFTYLELPTFYHYALDDLGSLKIFKSMFALPSLFVYTIYWAIATIVVFFGAAYKSNRYLSFLIFLININYIILVRTTIDGGDKLLGFLTFMLIFVHEGATKYSIRQMINNAALLILQVHFCLLYFINAGVKIRRDYWRDGSLFNNVWHMSFFANQDLIPYWFHNSTLYFITAWSVILFELLFPILIWYIPFKKPLLLLGIIFHITIGLLLSIPEFSLTMIAVYPLFYNFKESSLHSRTI
jgi:hypothetical protein